MAERPLGIGLKDWHGMLVDYEYKLSQDSSLHLRKYAEQIGQEYTTLSRRFTELREERALAYLSGARSNLAKGAARASERLVGLIESEDENIAVKATTSLLDRVGMSPPAVALQVSQQVQHNVVVAPLFASSDAVDAVDMFKKPNKVIDVEPE